MPEEPMKLSRWWYAFGLLATLFALYYFVRFIVVNATELPEIEVTGSVLTGFTLALLVYVVVLGLGGLVWHLLMIGVGGKANPLDTFGVFFVSQFAKYIPGNIAHHIGRVVLARNRGMDPSKVLLTMMIEVGWAVSAAASLAMITLLSGDSLVAELDLELPTTWQLLLLGLTAILIPALGAYFLSNPGSSTFGRVFRNIEIKSPGWKVLVFTFFLYLLNFVFSGGIIIILTSQVFLVKALPLFSTAGIFAVAWVVGFLTPGAPAGLGVREAILVSFLTPTAGAGMAIGITLLLRLVTSLGEAVVLALGLFLSRKASKGTLPEESVEFGYSSQ